MDREEYEQRQREIAEHAKAEGAWYYDPDSPVIWKRYIIGPVPLWRRTLWWFFPPSHYKMRKIMQRRTDKICSRRQVMQHHFSFLELERTLSRHPAIRKRYFP